MFKFYVVVSALALIALLARSRGHEQYGLFNWFSGSAMLAALLFVSAGLVLCGGNR